MADAGTDRRDFFISFNRADRAWATWIAWVLEQAGYSVIFQDWDFRGSFIEEMHQATLRCARTLVVLSDNYLRSEFARSEAWAALAGDAVGRKDRVVTIKVGSTGDLGLLAHFAHLDLRGEAEADADRLLVERARMSLDPAHRAKPQTRPPFPGRAPAKPDFPPPAPGPKLAVNNLPPLNPDFVGREGVLAELRRLLAAGQGPAVLTQAITGLGGIGKTQTARAYAYRHLADYELIWWLRAETPATLAADYAALAGPLGLDPDTADQAKLTAAIRQQLQSTAGWLLIFDNVEDLTLPRDSLPGTGGGHALITSRRTDWRGVARVLSLELMPEDEALQLLTGSAEPQTLGPAEFTAARELAAELGCLPLALAQARAYMVETGRRLDAYLRLFRTSRPADFAADRGSPDYPASYATTWRISIDAATAACLATRPLLELLAFFAPDPLPIEVLAADLAALPPELRNERARDEAVAALHRYSLIQACAGTITVHRLVQAVTREDLDEATRRRWADAAVLLVNRNLPRPSWEHTNWPSYSMLLPHTMAALGWAERIGTSPKMTATTLSQLASYHHARAAWVEAESLFQRAHAILEKTVGPEHSDLGGSLNNLGNLYLVTGRYAEAEPLFQRAIAVGEKALGSDHPDFATVLNNLAYLYSSIGRYSEAKPLFERAVAIGEKSLGPDHPDLGSRLNNLANLYQVTGHYEEAEPLFERAVALFESSLGPDHPKLAIGLNSLANLYRSTGRDAEAEPLFERAVAIGEKTLGPDHPDLATWLNNLANVYQDTGRYAEAEPLFQRAIATLDASLPPDHPRIATVRANYARLLASLGRPGQSAVPID